MAWQARRAQPLLPPGGARLRDDEPQAALAARVPTPAPGPRAPPGSAGLGRAAVRHRERAQNALRVRVEIMGSQKCGIVGSSQPVLMTINPMIFTRTRTQPRSALRPAQTLRGGPRLPACAERRSSRTTPTTGTPSSTWTPTATVSRSCACIGSPCLRHCVHGASIGVLSRSEFERGLRRLTGARLTAQVGCSAPAPCYDGCGGRSWE
jgi:hypothetical protein